MYELHLVPIFYRMSAEILPVDEPAVDLDDNSRVVLFAPVEQILDGKLTSDEVLWKAVEDESQFMSLAKRTR
ncbi:MAG: hypothetical protein WBG50_02110 [Desulfomonilaceae bacterium]